MNENFSIMICLNTVNKWLINIRTIFKLKIFMFEIELPSIFFKLTYAPSSFFFFLALLLFTIVISSFSVSKSVSKECYREYKLLKSLYRLVLRDNLNYKNFNSISIILKISSLPELLKTKTSSTRLKI